ncbi:2Fe-2S iron-sulfur cluster-binding protein [Cupriavidus necator]
MPNITFIEHNGTSRTVEAELGQSVMQAAMNQLLPGLVADCGGYCSCATCHAYVDDAWISRIPPAGDDEKAMLECVLHIEANSRLTCQITVTPELDGMVLRTPISQT